MKNLLNSKAIALEVWLYPLKLCLCPIKRRALRVNTKTTLFLVYVNNLYT